MTEANRTEEHVAKVMVEDSGGHARPRFRTMDQTGIHWTDDANKAIRFSRRADAEMFAAGDEDAWRITEHQWVTVDGDSIHAEKAGCALCAEGVNSFSDPTTGNRMHARNGVVAVCTAQNGTTEHQK